MSPRQILLTLAAVFVVIGLVLGLRTISAGDVSCGSVLAPSNSGAESEDYGEQLGGTLQGATPDDDPTNNVDACSAARGDAKPLAYGGLGLGVMALIAGFVASGTKPTNSDGSAKPSMWR